MIRLAKRFGRHGYQEITVLLRIEGWRVNHKKIEYLRNEEGPQLPHWYEKWWQLYHHASSVMRLWLTHPNHIWVIGFVHDKRSNGRSYKIWMNTPVRHFA